MMRPFCDLCDKPADGRSYYKGIIRRRSESDPNSSDLVVHVSFNRERSGMSSKNESMDICSNCFDLTLRQVLTREV